VFNLNVPFVVEFGSVFVIVEAGYAPSHVRVLGHDFLDNFVLSVVIVPISLFDMVGAGITGEGWQVWVVQEVLKVVEVMLELLLSTC
jgi:hypothetical protein